MFVGCAGENTDTGADDGGAIDSVADAIECDGRQAGDDDCVGNDATGDADDADGAGPVCGDLVCDDGEDAARCVVDCVAPDCGDGLCTGGETHISCRSDCDIDFHFCGDEVCDHDEDPVTCAVDCESCDDEDGDGVCDVHDNCPSEFNLFQEDEDGDGRGDACDPCPTDPGDDPDGDGICAAIDNCRDDANPDQADVDNDGFGDACDNCPDAPGTDIDRDSVCGAADNCPRDANTNQSDVDGDGIGDACDFCPVDGAGDMDGDGVCDSVDRCPGGDDLVDLDENGIADACDACPSQLVDRMVFTWRNAHLLRGAEGPLTFQIVVDELGRWTVNYAAVAQVSRARAGLEARREDVFAEVDDAAARMRSGHSIQFEAASPPVTALLGPESGGPRFSWSEPVDLQELPDEAGFAIHAHPHFRLRLLDRFTDTVNVDFNGYLWTGEGTGGCCDDTPRPFPTGGPWRSLFAGAWGSHDLGGEVEFTYHTDTVACFIDCAGTPMGNAWINECGICVGGTTGAHPAAGMDCLGACGGPATVDACGRCVSSIEGGTPDDEPSCDCEASSTPWCHRAPLSSTATPLTADFVDEDAARMDRVWSAPGDARIASGCLLGSGWRDVLRFGLEVTNPSDEAALPDETPFNVATERSAWRGLARARLTRDGEVVAGRGWEPSFCVVGAVGADCAEHNCSAQGIGAGCTERFPGVRDCQWVDVTGLAAGPYVLEILMASNGGPTDNIVASTPVIIGDSAGDAAGPESN